MTSENTTTTQLTQNEVTALRICLNYDRRDEQLSDNYSNGGTEEFMAALNWNAQQVGGLMTSLTEKGLGYHDEEEDVFWLTEAGVNAIFDIIEQGEAQVTEDYFATTDDPYIERILDAENAAAEIADWDVEAAA
jgi:hypothetical protein